MTESQQLGTFFIFLKIQNLKFKNLKFKNLNSKFKTDLTDPRDMSSNFCFHIRV